MKIKAIARKFLPLAAGLVVVAGLVIWLGGTDLFAELGTAGWKLLWVCVFILPDQVMAAFGWRILFPAGRRPNLTSIFWASWMGSAINTLLPVAAIGGELAKTRLVVLWGADGLDAVSATIVDKSAQALAIFIWGLIGLVCLAKVAPGSAIFWGSVVSAIGLGLGIAVFIGIQARGGIGAAARWASTRGAGPSKKLNKWNGLLKGAENVDTAVRKIYARPFHFALSTAFRLAGRFVLVGEIMLAAWLMGTPISLIDAVILKALVSVVRGAAFAVPGGLGLQEGSYIALGALIGIPPPLALALSLATRIREIVPSIPVILAWQGIEARQLAKRLTKS